MSPGRLSGVARRLVHHLPWARRHLSALRELGWTERRLYLRAWIRDVRGIRRAIPPRVQSVLVICHGNIMRSAFGAALLQRALADRGHLHVSSAGVATRPGRPADPRACSAAEELGFPLAAHRSRSLTAAMVETADVLIAMDFLNEARLLARFPWAEPRLRLLGEFDPVALTAEIPDPYRADPEEARRCFLRVARCVDALATQPAFDARQEPAQRA